MKFGLILTTCLGALVACNHQGTGSHTAGAKTSKVHDFTVMSYNVENFFDQVDDDRNESYKDFRITSNSKGFSSNYGEPVLFEGQSTNFTEVKAMGIRKVLQTIIPGGPDIAGLTEIESAESLDLLLSKVKDMGYVAAQFSEWKPGMTPTAIGLGIISKFPISDWDLIQPTNPNSSDGGSDSEPLRPILKATIDVHGQALVVYVNHWKSKRGPESLRIACAEALQDDIANMVAANPAFEYLIVGDLNSNYNEDQVMANDPNNDTNGRSGINTVLKARGDLNEVKKSADRLSKYNLHYDIPESERRTAYYKEYGWNSLDHIIIGPGMIDQQGIEYVSRSFHPVSKSTPGMSFLFKPDGGTNRWHQIKKGRKTVHSVGGYSDHIPIMAHFTIVN